VIMAAEDRGPLMHAHVGMMLALHGTKPIPEYDSSKEKHWGRRKLKRDVTAARSTKRSCSDRCRTAASRRAKRDAPA
jgi:hypothetical protein